MAAIEKTQAYVLSLTEDEAQYIASLLTRTSVKDDQLSELDCRLHEVLCSQLAPIRGIELNGDTVISVQGWDSE